MKDDKEYQDVELAYLAGFIDGEGTIVISTVGSTRKGHKLIFAIDNVHSDALVLAQHRLGGRIQFIRKNNPQWRDFYRWVTQDSSAERALRTMLPYLRQKRQQAELALKFRELGQITGGEKGVRKDGIKQKREEFAVEMRRMNRGMAG